MRPLFNSIALTSHWLSERWLIDEPVTAMLHFHLCRQLWNSSFFDNEHPTSVQNLTHHTHIPGRQRQDTHIALDISIIAHPSCNEGSPWFYTFWVIQPSRSNYSWSDHKRKSHFLKYSVLKIWLYLIRSQEVIPPSEAFSLHDLIIPDQITRGNHTFWGSSIPKI